MDPPIEYYATSSIGDVFALPFVDFGVGAMAVKNGIDPWVIFVALALGIVMTFYNRVIQYKVKFTWTEKVHFVYFSIQVTTAALWFWFIGAAIQNGGTDWVFMLIALGGLIGYGLAWKRDLAQGRL